MKIIVANSKKIEQKVINIKNNVVSFEFYGIANYFVFHLNEDVIHLENSEGNFEVLDELKKLNLSLFSKLTLKSLIDEEIFNIYFVPDYDYNYLIVKYNDNEVKIGSKTLENCNLVINSLDLGRDNIVFSINNNVIQINNNSKYRIYVNDFIYTGQPLKYGDIIFINGIIITYINEFIYLYNVNEEIFYDIHSFESANKNELNLDNYKNINFVKYINNDTFHISLNLKKDIIKKSFNIDPPSNVELKESNPLLLTMMPMILMSFTSIIMSVNVINNIKSGKTTWEDNSVSLIFSGIMILSMVLYPVINYVYRKHKESKREILRIEEYKDYIYENKLKIKKEIDEQKNILINNFKDTHACVDIFNDNMNMIWDKKNGDEDFLIMSLGKGRIKPYIDVNYPEEHFTIDRDKLRIQITKLKEEVSYVEDCPIVLNLFTNNNVSFIGEQKILYNYMNSFLLRLFCSHSYNDVKLCVFSDDYNKNFWSSYSSLPYLWDSEKNLRFFVNDNSSMLTVVKHLDLIYKERKERELTKNDTNYILLIDNIKLVKDVVFLNEILSDEKNYGFTVIFISDSINKLPSYCKDLVKISMNESKLITKENNYREVIFSPDIYEGDVKSIFRKLAKMHEGVVLNKMPDKITFLEMYKVDSVDKLNVLDNWNNNTTLDSMSVPIGVNDFGELVCLDLHENAHGPHGLIAGMTGSGKSEFIISLILSLSIRFSPYDIQFLLIDYKGGGLSNTFYCNDLQKKLPHVVGVITNISESEISRCLISLESEIKRRQTLFSQVSIKYNEANIDIYKYQQLARINKEIEYLSHLVIISDEFAELKTQNPEFIEKLISLARIGRSLGIHLILSTQKPSGIVDNQIWSNSKFKVCLKVQDKADSREVIGVDSAVYLNNPGRFYMQIGYNELFLKGQCAHSGAPYYIDESESKLSNYKIEFINNFGKIYYSYNNYIPDETDIEGTHVSNVVRHLIQVSDKANYKVKALWNDSLEEKIYLDDLLVKYKYLKNKDIEIVFGEYDEVDKQRKGLARYSLVNKGNIIIYGLTGSGKSELIHTSIFFLLKTYSVSELNLYIMDFSSENSKIFGSYPQVGDVMYLYDKEKIVNTFKYINSLLLQRKTLLANYGGSIYKYNEANNKKLPVIFIIISGLERLFENYNDLENTFMDLTRDCYKFGITFMVSVSSINGVRNKLITSFKQVITLEMKDKYDYDSLFGSKVKYKLQHILGRGFIKIGDVYEMQSARIVPDNEDMFEYIDNYVFKVFDPNDIKAPNIPVLPNVVTFDYIKKHLKNSSSIPIGVDIDSLKIVSYNFIPKEGTIIIGNDTNKLEEFIKSLIINITSFPDNKALIFTDGVELDVKCNGLIKSDYGKYLMQLLDLVSTSDKKINYYVIFKSLANILEMLSLKEKALFYDLITKLKNSSNFNIILLDNVSSVKKYEYSDFYTSSFNNNKGIFIGDGIFEQYVIKITKIPRKYRDIQNDSFGFYIDGNKIQCIKVLEYDGDE